MVYDPNDDMSLMFVTTSTVLNRFRDRSSVRVTECVGEAGETKELAERPARELMVIDWARWIALDC